MGTPHKVFHSLLDLEALDPSDSSPPRLASSSPLLAFYLGPLRSPAAIVLIYNRGLSPSLGIKDNGIGGIRAESKERHKVMIFVGIQMGFGSMGRRRSLRKTWFPSDREGLRRCDLWACSVSA